MNRIAKIALVLLTVASLPFAGQVVAESTPEARQWLEKMAAVHEKGPFSVNYSADMTIAQGGQTMDAQMSGRLTQADKRHVRMQMTISMNVPGMDQQMEMQMLGVADGEFMWMEMNNPMLGGKQVMKFPLDKMEEMAQLKSGAGMGAGFGNLDPMKQVEEMARMFDMDVVDVSEGRVTLSANMTDEAKAKLGGMVPAGDAGDLSRFIIVLDEKTGFPTQTRVGGDEPVMVMNFTDLEFHDSVEPGTFSYAPPDGVQVIDMGRMLDAMGAASEPEEKKEEAESQE